MQSIFFEGTHKNIAPEHFTAVPDPLADYYSNLLHQKGSGIYLFIYWLYVLLFCRQHHNYGGVSETSAPGVKITGAQNPSFWLPYPMHVSKIRHVNPPQVK